MSRRPNDVSNVPRWIRIPVGLLAAAFVGPAVLGMLGSIVFVLAPFGIVVLPFILWGLTRGAYPEPEPSRAELPPPPHRVHPPVPQPS